MSLFDPLSSEALHSGPDDFEIAMGVVAMVVVVMAAEVAAVMILLHIFEARIAEVQRVFSDSALGEDTSTCGMG